MLCNESLLNGQLSYSEYAPEDRVYYSVARDDSPASCQRCGNRVSAAIMMVVVLVAMGTATGLVYTWLQKHDLVLTKPVASFFKTFKPHNKVKLIIGAVSATQAELRTNH
jgi:hypothetical protein